MFKPIFFVLLVALAPIAKAETCPSPGQAWSEAPALLSPVAGQPTRQFGMVMHPLLHVMKLHAGVDFAGPRGDPIVASAAGSVVEAGRHGEYGNFVGIDHGNGLSTIYAHLDRIDVADGTCVAAGQKIGTRGNTGLSSEDHLHFEVRRDGQPFDPEPLLKAGAP